MITTIREFLNKQKIINEASFNSFSNDDILSDKYIKDFINRDDLSNDLLDLFIEYDNLDEDNKEEIEESEDYYNFIKNELERNLENAKENIYDKIDYNTDKITIYRAITVDDNWIQHLVTQGKRLGIYWSWDKSGADAHWGYNSNKKTAVVKIEIDEKYIDWVNTLQMNMHPNYTHEKEIRLFKNTKIKIKSIKIDDVKIDISKLKNKVFYS
jgi:hypothetical protein